MSDERRVAPAPTAAEAAAVAPDLDGDAPPPRPGARDSSPAARRRGRMTLRIPDDEVARPETADPPPVRGLSRPAPASGPSLDALESAPPFEIPEPPIVPMTPMRIISITSDLPPAPPLEPDTSPLLTASEEEEWAVPSSDGFDDGNDVEVVSHISIEGAISESEPPPPVDSSSEALTAPILPSVPSMPRVVEPVAEEEDEEDIRFEDDALTPALPRVELTVAPEPDGERRSDPGDAPEVSAEDMVAVEPAPAVVRAHVELPPMRSRLPSQPSTLSSVARPVPAPPLRPPLVIVPPHVGTGTGPQSIESVGPRRKARLWWEELFNDDYLRTMEKVTDAQIAKEVDFIETSLGLERGGAMLDLACGTGRQAIDLARRGYEVVAFDLSLAMLARAGDEAQERDAKLNFVQGDMREMSFEAQFDGVYCWNTSFGFFDEEKNAHVIDRVHHALKAGGLFLLDVVNRDFMVRQSPSLCWFEGDGCICMDEMTVDFITSRMKVKRTLMLDDGRSREIEYSMRVYSLHELGKILHEHGFKVCEVSGRLATPGVYFGNESPRTIILAEKR
jgi:SAM-dependent methyltransferase